MKIFETTSTAYLAVLRDVWYNPDYTVAPRHKPAREKLAYTFQVQRPSGEAIVTCSRARNDVLAAYLEKEAALYDSGTLAAADFAAASKFWLKLANPDGTINSNYGYLLWHAKECGSPYEGVQRTSWEWAVHSLKEDRDTRQAVMHFSRPRHLWVGNKDQVCTLSAQFLIRHNRLNLIWQMRSQDVVLGLVYDLPWACRLLERMLAELDDSSLTMGTYTHVVNSLHVYEKDRAVVEDMLGQPEMVL